VKVRFTPSARTQFLAAIIYIHRDNPMAAATFRRKAEKAPSRLQKFPRSGRRLPEFPDLPFREVIVAPHRFFYRVKGNTVYIAAGQIFVFDPTGKQIDTIEVPQRPTSLVFAGPDRKTLFITARSSLYRVLTH